MPTTTRAKSPAKKKVAEKASPYMGIYLDDESRVKLRELETLTGKSGSAVIRELIKNADGARMARLSALVAEMKSLIK